MQKMIPVETGPVIRGGDGVGQGIKRAAEVTN
jgi:hypothetical protein